MDNDNKINFETDNDTSIESKEVSLFLQEELIPLKKRKRVTTYDLEKEYAKTKKNRAYSIWITMTITVVVVVLTTWVVVKQMSVKNDNVQVSLDAFEDLNLKNLFDALSKTQDLYEKASKAKAELQASLDSRLTQAKHSRDVDLENTNRMKLTKKAKSDREREILDRFNNAVYKAHQEIDEKLAAAELELKQYEEQLKSFDSENVAKAQTWEKEMDSQRQVHEIEKNKMSEEYENQLAQLKQQMTENQERSYQERRIAVNDLTTHYEARIAKLDPQIKDNKVNSIIQKSAELASGNSFNPDAINQQVKVVDEEYTAELNEAKRKYDEFIVLSNIAQGIPFTNGMSNLLKSERQIAYDMTYSIARSGAERIGRLKAENIQLSKQLENSRAEAQRLRSSLGSSAVLMDAYASTVKADGFVLNYAPGNAAIVFVSSSAKSVVKNDGSSRAVVTAGDGSQLASGALWFKDSVYYLTLDEEVEAIPSGAIIKIKE